MLGADGDVQSYNLFSYCGNNPVTGFDPNGEWNWGGVAVGAGIIAATIMTVATFGLATPLATVVAAAAISTGATMIFAAATDSAMVMDFSASSPVREAGYGKTGVSVVVDFKKDGGIYGYGHTGGGLGKSSGGTYSVGVVENLTRPEDYSKSFVDLSVGKNIGIDHCYNPTQDYKDTTKATSVTFGLGSSFGVGYDYYYAPVIIAKW